MDIFNIIVSERYLISFMVKLLILNSNILESQENPEYQSCKFVVKLLSENLLLFFLKHLTFQQKHYHVSVEILWSFNPFKIEGVIYSAAYQMNHIVR